jgi:hypothetical protein
VAVAAAGRRLLLYMAANTVLTIAFHVLLDRYLWPHLRRMAERRADAERDLREELGRQPTEQELIERLMAQTSAPADG